MTEPVASGAHHRRREVRAVLLVALTSGPATGFELMGRIEQQSGGSWRPDATAVYPMLQQLLDEGLVTVDVSGGRHSYTPTATGEAAARAAVLEGVVAWPHPNAALRRDLLRAVGAFTLAAKQAAAIASADQLTAAIELTDEARRQLLDALGQGSQSVPEG